ncbi:MAG: flagellar hook-associated protein FlgK [Planctomycetales bacterium]|nr:flagellar hook-associated protein FlgK [Planctomycetales bacterium]
MGNELGIGLTGLRAAQVGLEVVAQNLANASTPGYHRQVVHQVDRMPTPMGGLSFGNGVEVDRIGQVRDQLIEHALATNLGASAGNAAHLRIARRVEAIVSPGAGALNERLSGFFDAVTTASRDPGNRVSRDQVVHAAANVADGLNRLAEELGALRGEIDAELRTAVSTLNDIAEQVAELNVKIQESMAQGYQPNDLIDRRDQLIAELSEIVNVDLDETVNGLVIAGGPSVFGTSNLPQFSFDLDGTTPIVRYGEQGILRPQGGSLAGLLAARNELLPQVETQLDQIANGVIAIVDSQHVEGIGLAGGFDLLRNARNVENFNVPLASLETVMPLEEGEIVLGLTNMETGERTLHAIAINPETDSLADVIAALDAIDHFGADANAATGNVALFATAGYRFDFTGMSPGTPDVTGLTGTAVPKIQGLFRGSESDTFEVRFAGTGTIGVTPDLKAEVYNNDGDLVATINVGQGYVVGKSLDFTGGQGLTVRFAAGNVVANESFSVNATAPSQADSSHFLTALGFNTLFVGQGAAGIGVSQDLLQNSDRLATSKDGTVADSSNINQLLADRRRGTSATGGLSIEAFQQEFVTSIGREVQFREGMETHLNVVVESLEAERASVSGVDPNEELVRMLQYQRAFQTAAKYLDVINQLTAELMQIVG